MNNSVKMDERDNVLLFVGMLKITNPRAYAQNKYGSRAQLENNRRVFALTSMFVLTRKHCTWPIRNVFACFHSVFFRLSEDVFCIHMSAE